MFRYVAALAPDINDAEEIVQQAAVLLWSKFDQYDPQQPFTPWACRFALNVAKQWLASRQRWQSVLETGLAEQLVQRRAELRPQFDSRLRHLDACLEKMPPDHRATIESFYFHRRSVDAIANESQRSVEAIYKLLQRIRVLLRQCIERSSLAGE